nr:armadillo repeat-containing protein 6 homolog [Onthophagus taurus]
MDLVITQDCYEEIVHQNMSDFELSQEDAIKETIEQLKSQGVDLSNIITDMATNNEDLSPELQEALISLKCLVQKHAEPSYITGQLDIIQAECKKGLQYQVYAGKLDTYPLLMEILQNYESDNVVINSCFTTLIKLMDKQPDLLDDVGIQMIIKYLDKSGNQDIMSLVLKWTKVCCIMHEQNRQSIFNAEILGRLKTRLNEANANLLRDILAVLRALVLDDDVRVDFGKAHEHARVIASDTLCAIMRLLEKFKTEELFVMDLLLTISTLLVRTEFCKKVEDAGGLPLVKYAMEQFPANEKIIRYSLKVLKALAGNDECKAHIIQFGFSLTIVECLERNNKNASTATFALACIAALTLRCPENSKAFYDHGAPNAIVDVMKLHRDNEAVQKHSSWAIRNMVSRSRYQNEKFLSLGVEEILKANLKTFPKSEYDTKAALRDLGCDVNFKEEWTGKGGKITTQNNKAK